MKLSITTLWNFAESRHAEFRILFMVMLNVFKVSVIMLLAALLNVVMLIVVAPKTQLDSFWCCRYLILLDLL